MVCTPQPDVTVFNSCEENYKTENNVTHYLINENSYNSKEEVYKKAIAGSIAILGTIGNGLTFVVMRRGSLRNVSTCFYMAMLSVADTGEWI